MAWFRSSPRGGPDERVEAARAARRNQGHALTLLQEAIVRTIAAYEPQLNAGSQQALSRIKSAIETDGQWEEQEEWRISTWFVSTIVRGERDNRPWFTTTVSCDGQSFSCGCPSVERAYSFMRFYQRLIVDQYYSVGPPWADQPLFKP